MLVLATDWGFDYIRHYAIKEIEKQHDVPIARILLARRAAVPQWLAPEYISLSLRVAPLSKHEADLLGCEALHFVTSARERVLERRMSLVGSSQPRVLLGKLTFLHSGCWTTLTQAWRRALTEEKYYRDSEGPTSALFAALNDLGTAQWQRRLCKGCNSWIKVGAWLDLKMDEAIATSIVEEALKAR